MSEEYRIALAYSNIQRTYSILPFVSGVIADEESQGKIPSKGNRKNTSHKKFHATHVKDSKKNLVQKELKFSWSP